VPALDDQALQVVVGMAALHRAVLAWSRRATGKSDREVGVLLAGALVFFWNLRGAVSEGLACPSAAWPGSRPYSWRKPP
jgi:hypothetical protein